jgi:hypothetical protein
MGSACILQRDEVRVWVIAGLHVEEYSEDRSPDLEIEKVVGLLHRG